MKGRYKIKTIKNGRIVRETDWIQNRILLSDGFGLNIIARRMAGDKTFDPILSTASIGTSSVEVNLTDTGLFSPVLEDIPIARVSFGLSDVAVEYFMTDDSLPNDIYREFLVNINPKSPRAFARSLIEPEYTKSEGEDTLVVYEFDLTSVE